MYLKIRKKWNSVILAETYKSRADLRHYAKGVMTASKTGIVIVCIFLCILLILKMLQILLEYRATFLEIRSFSIPMIHIPYENSTPHIFH